MDNPTQQIVERLKQANNILVTVSSNPSVDQLAGAIGFTLLLNKMGKHGSAVFSGEVPPVLEFLQPEETLEKTTDSLRDFIIALDKSKADKLRYKVEEDHVKIFITPYRTSITDKDLEFSQGDFNVDVVLALGVRDQNDLDQAITSHGRILHDATVVSLSTEQGSTLGSINWADQTASSLSEMLVKLSLQLGTELLDEQMATAFLTGIVAETDRFSNAKTSAATMDVSSKLMAAGANQQLVASKLQPPEAPVQPEPTPEPEPIPEVPEEKPAEATPPQPEPVQEPEPEQPEEAKPEEATASADGSLEINHGDAGSELELGDEEDNEVQLEQIHIDDQGTLRRADEVIETKDESEEPKPEGSKLILEPPTMGGTLTANAQKQDLEPSSDPLSATNTDKPLLTHDSSSQGTVMPMASAPDPSETPALELPQPVSANPVPPDPFLVAAPPAETEKVEQSLADLEKSVQQTDEATPPADLGDARQAVKGALDEIPPRPEPITALNAQPLDLDLGHMVEAPATTDVPQVITGVDPVAPPAPDPLAPPELTMPSTPATVIDPTGPMVIDPNAPPPVPPPMMPPLPDIGDMQPPAGPQP